MKHSIHDYINATIPELLTDPYFLEWVRFPNADKIAFWEAYMVAYPNKAAMVQQAAAIARSMHVKHETVTPLQQRNMWDEIYNNIDPGASVSKKKPWIYALRAAAVMAGLAAVIWLIYRKDTKQLSYAAAYGEIKHFWLPDSTEVTLNGNSSIKYAGRQVWLNGEAFFNVHKSAQQVFEVHSNEGNIQVLGTSFNIRDRRGVTSVLLSTGKVKVATGHHQELILSSPGEMVQYSKQERTLVKKKVVINKYIGWQQKRLLLDQTTIAGFFERLEDEWGYKIKLSDTSMLSKKISGEIEMTDKQVLMNALAVILDAKVTEQGSTIIVTPNNN